MSCSSEGWNKLPGTRPFKVTTFIILGSAMTVRELRCLRIAGFYRKVIVEVGYGVLRWLPGCDDERYL